MKTILSVNEYLENRFEGSLLNLMYFLIGLSIGIVIFLIVSLVIYFVYRARQKKNITKDEVVLETDEHYKNIIQSNKELYLNVYKDKSMKEKINGIGSILYDMANDISSLYYLESKDPIFEVSIEKLVEFFNYLAFKVDYVVDDLLENKLHFIDVVTNYKTKDIKLTKVLELAKSKQPKEEDKSKLSYKIKKTFTSFGKKIATKIINKTGNKIIDYEFDNLIEDIGEDLNKLYTNQHISFNGLSQREMFILEKNKKHERKMAKRKLGDSNV